MNGLSLSAMGGESQEKIEEKDVYASSADNGE